MIIAFNDADIEEYMESFWNRGLKIPCLSMLISWALKWKLMSFVTEKTSSFPGIMEHIERAGVHSGDSIAVYPAFNLNGAIIEKLIEASKRIALGLQTKVCLISSL